MHWWLVKHFCEPLSGGFVHHGDETCIDYLIDLGFGVWLPNLLGSYGAECGSAPSSGVTQEVL